MPALNLPDSQIFARLSKPWASKASGFCFYPEPGDEVVVGFIDSDPRYPMILGAMHNPKNTAPFPPDEKNSQKGLVVSNAGKTQALMIDSDDNTLTLQADDNTITLTGEGNIAVKTHNTLKLTAGMLDLQARRENFPERAVTKAKQHRMTRLVKDSAAIYCPEMCRHGCSVGTDAVSHRRL